MTLSIVFIYKKRINIFDDKKPVISWIIERVVDFVKKTGTAVKIFMRNPQLIIACCFIIATINQTREGNV